MIQSAAGEKSITAKIWATRSGIASAAEGVSPRDAAPKLKMHPFAAEKAFAHAGKYEPDELAAATVRLAGLDLALKGASRLSGELEFERALVDVTKPSR